MIPEPLPLTFKGWTSRSKGRKLHERIGANRPTN
jgi:hypothetical protein